MGLVAHFVAGFVFLHLFNWFICRFGSSCGKCYGMVTYIVSYLGAGEPMTAVVVVPMHTA